MWLSTGSSSKSFSFIVIIIDPSHPMSTHRYERETTVTGLNESVSALEFSPDGKILASGCEDGSITMFSTSNWKPLRAFTNVSPSTSLAWHPRIEGLLFCGFKSGEVHTIQTNRPLVVGHIVSKMSDKCDISLLPAS